VEVTPDRIVAYLREEAGRPLKAKELARELGVAPADYAAFRALLRRMEDEGAVYRQRRQRYAAPERINLSVGRVHALRSGAAFVQPDDGGPDLFVPADALEGALDGDRVVVRIERRRRGERPEASVVRVLERTRRSIVGTYQPARLGHGRRAGVGFVAPKDRRLGPDVIVVPGEGPEPAEGDLVVVRIRHWAEGRHGPIGEVERVLGRPGEPGVDVLGIIHGHELPTTFPQAAEDEAERLRETGLRDADLEGRTDLRELVVFTIDPADAKDHDDALSAVPLGDGRWEVGIHIADVAHYVRAGSALDQEAAARGTSIYLVDRVLPMLPHALSSDLCSLVPGRDRLTLSLLVRLDADGRSHGQRLVRSVIRSRHRLSYEEAQAVLDGETVPDPETAAALHALRDLGRALRARRQSRGSLDFDLPEARVVLNTAGEPTDIQRVLRLEAHRLIEDFMLLANENVAARAEAVELPFVYRIHEPPDAGRMEQLADFVTTLGYRLPGRGRPRPRDLQALLESVRGRPEEGLISTAVLRSMKQARYSADNVGHFGLAARRYTHFTSPIRRYPDLMVHRLCGRHFLDGARAEAGLRDALEAVARLSSERERVAVAAERESVALKKVEFMERHLGDIFEGTVSDVRAYGFMVLLDAYFVEGLVHVSTLVDDYYVYGEARYELVGEGRGRRFRLGDRVRVRVAAVDRTDRQIDFVLLDEAAGPSRTARRRRA
jgi:ribonuclease R